ncbi:unnamed protein product [Microthlaspi erraticum]|uniref:Reverse transcriptase zinc-binding domain-containing protein n=1 Tax=Microthlaspi erraticum TaxID=1685480 RepID=A0A6D2KV29_9BRAS|nr:unnamed protein product [Microthlaspi erraticum]
MISLQKSSITFSNKTPQEIRARVKSSLGIQKEGGQGKYLGLPESFGRKKKNLFTMIVDRIRQRSINYSSRFLSSAGKFTMLKSVLASIPTYSMSCFKLPMGLCKRIQSALTRFWWDSKPGKRKMCWLSWEKLTRSKNQGGLGFREIQSFNDSLLAKISWRILTNPSSLLSRILKGKYCQDHDFLDVPISSSTSHGWRGILIGRGLLKSNLGKAIEDGEASSLWNDPWLSLNQPMRPLGPPAMRDKDLTVAAIINHQTRDWNREKIQEVLPNHLSDILRVKLSKKGAVDSFLWLPTKSRVYSVKTDYYAAMEMKLDPSQQQQQHSINWRTDIWQAIISPKMKVFLWKIVQEALPTGENLLNRGLMDTPCCTHCGELETTDHLFFQCRFAKEVWTLSPFSTNIIPQLEQTFDNILKASKAWICLPPTGVCNGPLFPWICWSIWKSRNLQIFEDRSFSPAETITKTIKEAKEWQHAQLTNPKPIQRAYQGNSKKPHQNYITCFTDGAWCRETSIGGSGWIFVEPSGIELKRGSTAERFVGSPLMAEALSIRSALNDALEEGFSNILINSDALDLIQAINLQEPIKEIFGILFDIHALASMFASTLSLDLEMWWLIQSPKSPRIVWSI